MNSKKTLREVGSVKALMECALQVKKVPWRSLSSVTALSISAGFWLPVPAQESSGFLSCVTIV